MRRITRWAGWPGAALAIAMVSGAEARAGGLTYTTIAPAGAMLSNADGITSTGQIVGYYTDSSDNEHGFLYDGTTFKNIDYPGANTTISLGVNSSGSQIVGVWNNGGPSNGYLYNVSGASFSTIADPAGTGTRPTGVNNSGTVVGFYNDTTSGHQEGFVYNGTSYTPLNVTLSGATATFAQGINNSGAIVGYYESGGNQYGFLYNGTAFTQLDPFGSTFTRAIGIDSNGDIVGLYRDSSDNLHGYLYSNGTYTSLDYPGASLTGAQGINDSGEIVGYYDNSNGNQFGFLASPSAVPEPSSVVMAVSAALVVGLGVAWRNRCGAAAVTTRPRG